MTASTEKAIAIGSKIPWGARLKGIPDNAAKYRRLSSGLVILVLLAIATLTVGLWVQYDPNQIDPTAKLQSPNSIHWVGTDQLGRDVLTRIVYGARISLTIGLAAVVWSAVLGLTVGILAGYLGGAVDTILMRIVDAMIAFPSLILAMTLAFALGPTLPNIAIALAITTGPGFARVIRGQVMSLKERDFILAAHALGVPGWQIMVRHLLPHVTTLLAVHMSLSAGAMIWAESTLAFLGLGVPRPTPTWGAMLRDGIPILEIAPWISLSAAGAVTLAILGFNFMGDGVRDLLDPQVRNVRRA